MNVYSMTDIGRARSSNQDFVYASDQPVGNLPDLMIVADGMGGQNGGETASRMTVESMIAYLEKAEGKRPIPLLSEAIHYANDQVYEKACQDKSLEGMGTTVVAAVVKDEYLYVANVGDSRLYLIDEEEISQVTKDHSLVEEMVRMGEIKRKDARSHPDKNVITRAIGVHTPVRVDFFDVKLEPDDTVLLCSDGLTNMVEDSRILQIVRKYDTPKKISEHLISEANKNGGQDNVSVVLARI